MDMMYNFGCAQAATDDWLGPDTGCHGSAQAAVMGWPKSVKQIFSSVGGDVLHGSALSTCAGFGNPYKQAFEDWGVATSGRSAWDPIAVLIAVRGAAGVHTAEYDVGGFMTVADSGEETWTPPSGGGPTYNQSRIRYSGDNAQALITAEINALLCKPPGAWSMANWTLAAGQNCYPNHGATDLESPPSSSCGSFPSIAECEAMCLQMPACTGITVTKDSSGKWSCFRKSDVVLSQCDRATVYDTYVRHTYVLARGFNCWGARDGGPSHGATDLEHPASASCGTLSARGCADKCNALPECTAFVFSAQDHSGVGECYRKADVKLSECDYGTNFDTYLN
jgi:hypothetical protein